MMRRSFLAVFFAGLIALPVCPCRVSVSRAQVPDYSAGIPTIKEMEGFVSWKTLARKKVKMKPGDNLNGFSADVEELRDKSVKLMGFMMPLDQSDAQKHFLLSPLPPSCPFCFPAGPDQLVEVFTKNPIKFAYEPVKVQGTMNLLKKDPMGMMYRIPDAQELRD